MKKIICSKTAIFLLLMILLQHNSFAQASVFPKWSIFERLEKLVGKDLISIQEKDKKQTLTKAELNNYLSISLQATQLMDADWQALYIGFIKRVEANVYFNDAIMISRQPYFYQDTALTNLALNYIDAGYRALNKYNTSGYPPYIIVNAEYSNGRETSTDRQSVMVDETGVKNIRVEIAAAQGNVGSALDELYTLWGDNKQLFRLGRHDDAFTYSTAHRILRYNRMLQQYDEKLVYFCISLLYYNTFDDEPGGSFRNGDDLKNWNVLKQDIMETLDLVIANLDGSKKFNFDFPYHNIYHRQYDWLLLIISRFDDKDALGELENAFSFMNYAIDIDNTETNTDISARANRYAQKHFALFVTNLHVGKDIGNKCSPAKWITANMDKYGISDDDRKYVAKILKKCSKLRGY